MKNSLICFPWATVFPPVTVAAGSGLHMTLRTIHWSRYARAHRKKKCWLACGPGPRRESSRWTWGLEVEHMASTPRAAQRSAPCAPPSAGSFCRTGWCARQRGARLLSASELQLAGVFLPTARETSRRLCRPGLAFFQLEAHQIDQDAGGMWLARSEIF